MSILSDFWSPSHVGAGGHFGDPRDNGARRHRGTDYAHPIGTPIPSPVSGIVTGKLAPASWHGFGYQVTVKAASGEIYSFAHMNGASPLGVGASVSVGETLGPVGRTGATTGPCVHVEYNHGGFSDPAPHIAALVSGAPSAPATTPASTGHAAGNPFGISDVRGLQKIAKLNGGNTNPDNIWGAESAKGFAQFLRAAYGYSGDNTLGPVMWAAIARWLRKRWGYVGNDTPGPIMRAHLETASEKNFAQL